MSKSEAEVAAEKKEAINVEVKNRNAITVQLFMEKVDETLRRMEERLCIMENRVATMSMENAAVKKFVGEKTAEKMGSGPTVKP